MSTTHEKIRCYSKTFSDIFRFSKVFLISLLFLGFSLFMNLLHRQYIFSKYQHFLTEIWYLELFSTDFVQISFVELKILQKSLQFVCNFVQWNSRSFVGFFRPSPNFFLVTSYYISRWPNLIYCNINASKVSSNLFENYNFLLKSE